MNRRKMPKIKYGKKKIAGLLSWILTIALVCSLITVSPAKIYADVVASGECGTNVIWEVTNNGNDTYKLTLKPTGDNAKTNDFQTPSNTKGEAVPWVQYITTITEFVVEDGIEYLGNRLCYGATSLEKITIPASVTGTGNGLFRGCTSLKAAVIPGAITEMIDNLFYGCTSLEEVTLGEGTTVIGRNMVNGGCTSLEELTFPGTVTTINETALNGLTNLTTINYSGTIEQYKKLLDLQYGAPLKNANITVYCSDGEYQWGINGAIGESLKYSLNENTGVLTISGTGAMIDYPTVTSAPWNKYTGKIKTVLFMDGITYIGKNAFAKCANLENVYYLASDLDWENLKNTAGAGNDPLFAATNIASKRYGKCGDNVNWTLSDDFKTLTVSGTGKMYDYYNATVPWEYTKKNIEKVVIEEGVTYIGDNAFYGSKNLTDIQIASSVKGTGTFSISATSSLKAIRLPKGFEVIGSKCFEGCGNLKTIYLPTTLKVIDMKAFQSSKLISDVYYAGTEEQWNKIELSDSAVGNSTLKTANIHFMGTNADVSTLYSDVSADSPYHDSIQYMVNNKYMGGSENTFGTDSAINGIDVLEIFYTVAGKPAMYTSAKDWAIKNNIVTEAFDESLTGAELKELLKNMAVYNGFDSYELTIDDNATVTKGMAADAVAAFLQSDCGTADRFDKITSQVKAIIEKGGDGNLYVIAVQLFVPDVATKPGDCTFIIFPNGQTMMIDFGASAYEASVMRFLEGASIKNLDYFVISHPHGDHIGNAKAVAQYICGNGGKVGTFIYTGLYTTNALTIKDITSYLESNGTIINDKVIAGSTMNVGDVKIDVYSPYESQLNGSGEELENNSSLTMKFTYGTSTYLTCGDLYMSKEATLVKEYGSLLQADVVKLNHHGAYTSNSEAWINTVRAKVALVNDADNGSYYIRERFSALGAQYYSAGLDQTVMVKMDNNRNYSVTTGTDSVMRQYYSADKLDDLAAVENVESLISNIGTVTKDSKELIETALNAYNALTEEQKTMVYADKLTLLNDAQDTYKELTKVEETTTENPTTFVNTEETTTVNPTTAGSIDETTKQPSAENPTTKPSVTKVTVGKAKIKKATRTKNNKRIKLSLKKVKGATGYKIKYSTSKKFKKSKVITTKKLKKTIKKLKAGKKYYIKVRAYKAVKGKTYYGEWSKKKVVKIKK